MGYFSNGDEGDAFREAYCYGCVNWRDNQDGRGEGCPIMDLHFRLNYDQFKNDTVKDVLDSLIASVKVTEDDGLPGEMQVCEMYLPSECKEGQS